MGSVHISGANATKSFTLLGPAPVKIHGSVYGHKSLFSASGEVFTMDGPGFHFSKSAAPGHTAAVPIDITRTLKAGHYTLKLKGIGTGGYTGGSVTAEWPDPPAVQPPAQTQNGYYSQGNTGVAGQLLTYSPGGGVQTADISQRTYTVQSGDTLSGIAARYGTSVQALASVNQIAAPYVIHPGQVLTLPSDATARGGLALPGGWKLWAGIGGAVVLVLLVLIAAKR